MTLLACGINHKTADIDLRERVAVNMSCMYETLHELVAHEAVSEAVVLSTCNRTEIIAKVKSEIVMQDWLSSRYGVDPQVFSQHAYTFSDEAAVQHIMRVACGLDSMLLGEPQILGQVKRAYFAACEAGTVGCELQRLFPAVFSSSKKIRAGSLLGEHAIGLAYLVLQLSKKIFKDITSCRILFVGAGDVNALIAKHLFEKGVRNMVIANRSMQSAKMFVQDFGARPILMPELADALAHADIVVSATASQLPILGKGALESAQVKRKHKPMLLIDLAVPRDVEPQVSKLDNVYLYNMDDLQSIIEDNMNARQKAAVQAEDMVNHFSRQYVETLRVAQAGDMINQYRKTIMTHETSAREKALRQLELGADPTVVVTELSHQLTQTFLHQPTLQLRKAIEQEHSEKLAWLKEWLGLEE
jgi:glutamyl-tRNA reductase